MSFAYPDQPQRKQLFFFREMDVKTEKTGSSAVMETVLEFNLL